MTHDTVPATEKTIVRRIQNLTILEGQRVRFGFSDTSQQDRVAGGLALKVLFLCVMIVAPPPLPASSVHTKVRAPKPVDGFAKKIA
jgi:hypothetical protein